MIVTLTSSDIKKIVDLQNLNGFTDGWTEQMLQSSFRSGNYNCFGVISKERLVAFLGLTVAADTCDIEDILVDGEFRRRGLAKQLMAYAESFVKNKGINKIFLEVRQSNSSAICLYESLGFKKVSVRKNYYSNSENAIVYAKEI